MTSVVFEFKLFERKLESFDLLIHIFVYCIHVQGNVHLHFIFAALSFVVNHLDKF